MSVEKSFTVGMTGPSVAAIQDQLAVMGFPCGKADGVFGPATEAAVAAFQKSNGLLADGVVGPRTAELLAMPAGTVAPASMPPITVDMVCQMFPQTPRDPIERNLPLVLNALENAGLTWPPIVLAAIATIRAECAGFVPLDEFVSRWNTSPGGKPFDLYDNRIDLGNRGAPDGATFKGRGFVQLTGLDNYLAFGPKVGADLINSPELANDPCFAAALLAAFIKAVELPMKTALLNGNLFEARRLVNGGTNGLAEFTDAYQIGTRLLNSATVGT